MLGEYFPKISHIEPGRQMLEFRVDKETGTLKEDTTHKGYT